MEVSLQKWGVDRSQVKKRRCRPFGNRGAWIETAVALALAVLPSVALAGDAEIRDRSGRSVGSVERGMTPWSNGSQDAATIRGRDGAITGYVTGNGASGSDTMRREQGQFDGIVSHPITRPRTYGTYGGATKGGN